MSGPSARSAGHAREIVSIEEPSPSRVTPRCRHFAVCGGCALAAHRLPRAAPAEDPPSRPSCGARWEGGPRVAPAIGTTEATTGCRGASARSRHSSSRRGRRGPRDGALRAGYPRRGARRRSARSTPSARPGSRSPCGTCSSRRACRRPGSRPAGLARHVVVRTSRDEREAVAMLVVTRDEPVVRERSARFSKAPSARKGSSSTSMTGRAPTWWAGSRGGWPGAGTFGRAPSGPSSWCRPRPSSRRTSPPPRPSSASSSRLCPGRLACASSTSTAAAASSLSRSRFAATP